jgi:hypothetical protein
VISAVPQKPRQAVVEIFGFIRRHKLTLADLIEVGGENLRSSNSQIANRARAVSRCWELMARLSLKFADLEQAVGEIPDPPRRRRRHSIVDSVSG